MEPEEIEFIGEKVSIGVIPNFNFSPIHLIAGDIGPFRAGIPLHIPLWLAMHLREQRKCRIVPPAWMEVETLEEIKEQEKRAKFFTKMPCENYMIVAKVVLSHAPEDVPRADEIKTLIKDIFDTRCAKLRNTVNLFIRGEEAMTTLDDLTMLELHTVTPILPHSMDLLTRIQYPAVKRRVGHNSGMNVSMLNRTR